MFAVRRKSPRRGGQDTNPPDSFPGRCPASPSRSHRRTVYLAPSVCTNMYTLIYLWAVVAIGCTGLLYERRSCLGADGLIPPNLSLRV